MDEEITTVEGLAAALGDDEGQPQGPESEDEQAVEQPEAEPQAESDEEEEAPEESADEAEEDEAAEEEAGQPEGPADDTVVKWTAADGTELETPIAELKSGYMRHADYTQKTQQLAEERKQAAESIAQQWQQAQEFATEQAELVQIQRQLSTFQKADWNALYAQDAAKAGQLQAQYMQLQQRSQQVAASYQQKLTQRQQQQSAEFQQRSQEALEELKREIPGFGDQHLTAMREYGLQHGFTDAELAQVSDPRILKVLHEAAQWQALQSSKPSVQKKVHAAPPKAKKPGAASVPKSKREAAFKQMQQKRDVDSLAAFLAAQG